MTDASTALPVQGGGDFRTGDVLTRSFGVFRRRAGAFVMLSLLSHTPVYMLLTLLRLGFIGGRGPWLRVFSPVLALVCASLTGGAIVYGVVQNLRRQSFSIEQSMDMALRRLAPLVCVSIAATVLTVLGAMALIVPGVILFCMCYVAVPACAVERAGVRASLSRSFYLTKGYRWRIFGTVLAMTVVGGILGGVAILLGMRVLGPASGVLLQQAFQAVASAFGAVVVGVVYYQLRVAKDGVDIEIIAGVFD
jgi:hypothetical protein